MVGQVRRTLQYFWPRSEAHLYAELKRLVQLGYADAEKERFGRRSRTQYSITPAGRAAMRDWLRTPPQPPALEFEGLLRVMYADQGSVTDLLEALRVTHAQAEAVMEQGRQRVSDALATGGSFPQRQHLAALFTDFISSYLQLITDWTDRTATVVATWDSTGERAITDDERRLLADLSARSKTQTTAPHDLDQPGHTRQS
jgi:DNA-binding PadR family transcriptional regulator